MYSRHGNLSVRALVLSVGVSVGTVAGTAQAQTADHVLAIDMMKEVQGHIGTYLARTFDLNPGDIHFECAIDFATRQVTFSTTPGQWYGDRPLTLTAQVSPIGAESWGVQIGGQAGEWTLAGDGTIALGSIAEWSASYTTDLAVSPGGGPGSGGGGAPDADDWNDSHSACYVYAPDGPFQPNRWISRNSTIFTFNDEFVSEVYGGYDTCEIPLLPGPTYFDWTTRIFSVGTVQAGVRSVGGLDSGTGQGQFTMHIDRPICPADFDYDMFVTGEDFDAFVAAFELGTSESDFDLDGFVTGEDFDGYVAAFEAGC